MRFDHPGREERAGLRLIDGDGKVARIDWRLRGGGGDYRPIGGIRARCEQFVGAAGGDNGLRELARHRAERLLATARVAHKVSDAAKRGRRP